MIYDIIECIFHARVIFRDEKFSFLSTKSGSYGPFTIKRSPYLGAWSAGMFGGAKEQREPLKAFALGKVFQSNQKDGQH